jgi:taurine dioxygenase
MENIKILKVKSINSLIYNKHLIVECKEMLKEIGVIKFLINNIVIKKDMIKLAFCFGNPRKIKYLLTDAKNDVINVINKNGKRRSVFGDIWHSDHAYEKMSPNYTLIHCPIIPPYGGDTLFSFKKESYNIFFKKYGSIHDNTTIVNTMPDETKKILITKYPNLTNIETSCQKPLVKIINGVKVFTCNRYHTIASKQKDMRIDKITLETIFSIHESKQVIQNVSWENNQIVIWNNDLVLHKASNDYGSFQRKIWRILIDT